MPRISLYELAPSPTQSATAVRIHRGPVQPRKISNAYVNGLQTGNNMYNPVMFVYGGEHLNDQVVGYANPPSIM
jgi:hypothetical protein